MTTRKRIVDARADREGDITGVRFRGNSTFTPVERAMRMGDFGESGAGGLSIRSSAQSASFWRFRPSLEIWTDLKASERLTIRPSVKVGLSQALGQDRTVLATRFEDAPASAGSFATTLSGDRLIREVDIGLDFVRARGASLRLGYVGQFGDHVEQRAVRAKLVIPF